MGPEACRQNYYAENNIKIQGSKMPWGGRRGEKNYTKIGRKTCLTKFLRKELGMEVEVYILLSNHNCRASSNLRFRFLSPFAMTVIVKMTDRDCDRPISDNPLNPPVETET